MFFSEEKNQKTLTFGASVSLLAMAWNVGLAEEEKVFCFFSSEKKTFISLAPPESSESA